MGTLLEIGRHALEGVEVLAAFCSVAALGAGMLWGHAAADGDEHSATPQPRG
jgi:hypothetical protein